MTDQNEDFSDGNPYWRIFTAIKDADPDETIRMGGAVFAFALLKLGFPVQPGAQVDVEIRDEDASLTITWKLAEGQDEGDVLASL